MVSKLNDFIHCVEGYRKDEHYENILRDTAAVVEQADEFDPPPRKKVRGAQIDYKITYFTIINNILMSLRERFSGMQEYAFFELLDVNKFEEFANSFPMQHMDCLKNKYPGIFYCKSLVNELKYMYIDSDFKKCKSINTILELLYKLELTSAMPESIKLIKLLLTIPLTSVANERSFSTLDRIRSYLRSTMSQERLSSLARITIEKSILNDLDNKKELHDKILQEFAIKPRRLEFMYK
ncbi:zinc finger MYM-type protein 1-like [Oratosquilla oratoria]|uniref:zinc finger MYM-type protein 1-like n=1 Tax=Oratosquilla oratoria TaxID=337810 RepID=UPI003F76C488